jgi:outer membrane lipoprotein-sorting protein
MRNFLKILLMCAVLAAIPGLAAAAPKDNRPPSVIKAESWLQNLGTARARFLQTTQDGKTALGTFYLSRPGKLRFEYDPPVKDFIVADGFFIYFYDSELGEQSNAPIGQTLADFLLRDDLRLKDDITVRDVRRNGGLLLITLAQTSDESAGTLTLGFEENPFALKKWMVTDATGQTTQIELFKLETGIELPGSLFGYADPEAGKQHYNR